MTVLALTDAWWGEAACRESEPELFFPISATAASDTDIARAKGICASCPVRPQCLNYALHHCQEQGIWGGLTEDERRLLRRRTAVGGGHPYSAAGHWTPAFTQVRP